MKMNTIRNSATTLLLALLLIITACSKEDLGLTAEMKGTIDGDAWTATLRTSTIQNDNFVITGTATDGKTIILTIHGTAEGKYELNPIELKTECGALYKEGVDLNDDDAYISSSGEVNLTKVDSGKKKVSGDYNFVMLKAGSQINISGTFTDLLYTGE